MVIFESDKIDEIYTVWLVLLDKSEIVPVGVGSRVTAVIEQPEFEFVN